MITITALKEQYPQLSEIELRKLFWKIASQETKAIVATVAAQATEKKVSKPRLVDFDLVVTLTGLKKSTLVEYYRKGRFPRPHDMGFNNKPRWIRVDVDKWIKARVDERKQCNVLTDSKASV